MKRCGTYLVACMAMCLFASGARADFIAGDPVGGAGPAGWSIEITSISGITFEHFHVRTFEPGGGFHNTVPTVTDVPGGHTPNGVDSHAYDFTPNSAWKDSTFTVNFTAETIGGDDFDIYVYGYSPSTGHLLTIFNWDGSEITGQSNHIFDGDEDQFTFVPLPAPALLAGAGLLGLAGRRRLKKRRAA